MTDECTCGDDIEEHDPNTLECLIEDCPCIYFEDIGDDE